MKNVSAAVLVGKVVLLSFIVAPILAKNLEGEPFGTAIVGLICVTGLGLILGMSTTLLVAAGGTWLIILAAEALADRR